MTNSPYFKDETLTEHSHLDPDKHWIGEALPSAALAEMSTSGTTTATGTSQFPARADHTHDLKVDLGIFYTPSSLSVGSGASSYINGISHAGGTNMLASGSSQLLEFPKEGLWDVFMYFSILRSSGGFPANLFYRITFSYNNATVNLSMVEGNLPATRGGLWDTVVDQPTIQNVGGVKENIQFAYSNLDSVAHTIQLSRLNLVRRSSVQ